VSLDAPQPWHGLTFPDVLRDADTLAVPKALDRRTTLQGTEDIRW
jgi:hypothetical protein